MNFRRRFLGCSIAPAAALIVTAVFGTASAAHHGDPKNLWPEPWGTPNQSLTSREPFAPAIVGAKSKDNVETALKVAACNGTRRSARRSTSLPRTGFNTTRATC
jgi:hypothetical protein